MSKAVFTLPNIITFCRIFMAPVLLVILLLPVGRFLSFIAALIFSIAAVTDFLDGYLARRMNLITPLGKFLDPLADKVLVGVALIMMIPLERVQPWIVALIVGREILVTSMRVVAIRENMIIEVTRMAKYKTTFQIVAVVGLLLHFDYTFALPGLRVGVDFHAVGMGLLYIALFITVWTGADYSLKFYRKLSTL